MMNLKYLLITFAAAAALMSCKKQDAGNTLISGIVIDYDSRQPIPDVPVRLDYIDGNGGAFSIGLGNYKVATATTGDDGTFSFRFNADRTRTDYDYYRITANQFTAGHFGSDTEVYCNDADRRATPLKFILQRKISVTLRLIHDGPLNADDYISLEAYGFPYDGTGGALSFSANGNYAEESEIAELTPDHPTAFRHFTKRDGVYSGPYKAADSVVFHRDGEVYTMHF